MITSKLHHCLQKKISIIKTCIIIRQIFYETRCSASVCAIFFKNNILQGSVATPFRCAGNFNDSFVANFLLNLQVEEFRKSVDRLDRFRGLPIPISRKSLYVLLLNYL